MLFSLEKVRIKAGSLFSLPLVLMLAASGSQAQPIAHQITLPNTMNWCQDSMINELLSEINALRVQRGLAVLQSDPLGSKVAELRAVQFANYMATHPVNSPSFNPHEGYDTTAAAAGYSLVGENLAYLSMYPKNIVWAIWQNGLHLAAMLARDANVAGVSCVFFDGGPYWTYVPGIGQGGSSPSPTPTPSPSPTPNPTPTPPPPTNGGSDPTLDAEQVEFVTLINAFRAQNGAGPLQVSVALQNASQWMSADMATRSSSLGHIDSLGRTPSNRIAAFGYTYSPNGENIAAGFNSAQSVFEAWKNSSSHRTNMLNPSFVVTGIGRVYSPSTVYGWYWANAFGGVTDRIIGHNPPQNAPVISSFSANPAQIQAGQATTLSWSASSATSIFLEGIGDVSGTSSRSVFPAQTRSYKLTASNSAGSTSANVTVTVTSAPPPADTQAPTAPVITSATAAAGSQINLAWSASSDDVGVTGYQVIRNGSVIVSVPGGVRTLSDTGVLPASIYAYQIKAFDAAGNVSSPSGTVQVSTPAGPPPPPPPPPPGQSSCPGPASNAFTGCYYNNITISGVPALVRTDSAIGFNWGTSVPSPAITPFNFSARWQGTFSFEQALYTFSTIASDGMRMYIDGELVLDRWRDQPAYGYNVRRFINAGQHLVTVEYYQRTGLPFAQVSWQKN